MTENQNETTNPEWDQKFQALQNYHNEIYELIEQSEQLAGKQKDEALVLYVKALTLIDKALAEPLVCPENPNLTWEKAGVMVQKLKKTKKDLMSRVADLQSTSRKRHAPDDPNAADPPSYEEAMGLPSTSHLDASVARTSKPVKSRPIVVHVPRTYRELAEALQQLEVRRLDDGTEAIFPIDMTDVEMVEQEAEILFSHDNVQLYFIRPTGEVSCLTDPLPMQIVRLSGPVEGNRPPAYLQVGHWVYPLVPGLSPCFHSNYHAFILPDVHSLIEGAAVGIMLPEDADAEAYQFLETLLHGYLLDAPLAIQLRTSRGRRDASFVSSVVRGANYIRESLIRGAEKAGNAITQTTPHIVNKLTKDDATIDPSVSQGLKIAKDVSGKAVVVSSFVAGRLSSATMALGRFLAPHVQTQGTRLLSNYMDEQQAQTKVSNLLQFTAGAVEACGTVYSGLEEASRILAGSIANNTVIVVKHKYGNQAGEAVGNSFDTIGNVMTVTHTVGRFTPKGVIKITAKEAGKAIVNDQRNKLREEAGSSQNNERQQQEKFPALTNEVD